MANQAEPWDVGPNLNAASVRQVVIHWEHQQHCNHYTCNLSSQHLRSDIVKDCENCRPRQLGLAGTLKLITKLKGIYFDLICWQIRPNTRWGPGSGSYSMTWPADTVMMRCTAPEKTSSLAIPTKTNGVYQLHHRDLIIQPFMCGIHRLWVLYRWCSIGSGHLLSL